MEIVKKYKRYKETNKHSELPWKWYWREEDEETNCGIYRQETPFIAHAITRAPKYETKAQWEANAQFILEACNNYYRNEKKIEIMLEALKAFTGDPNHIDLNIAFQMAKKAILQAEEKVE